MYVTLFHERLSASLVETGVTASHWRGASKRRTARSPPGDTVTIGKIGEFGIG